MENPFLYEGIVIAAIVLAFGCYELWWLKRDKQRRVEADRAASDTTSPPDARDPERQHELDRPSGKAGQR